MAPSLKFLHELIFSIIRFMFAAMEQIILSFDMSCEKLGYDEAGDQRRDISKRLDKALRDAEIGKWAGGTCGLDTMEIFIRTDKPEEAITLIKKMLEGHRCFHCLKLSILHDSRKQKDPARISHNLTGPFEDRTFSRTHTRYK